MLVRFHLTLKALANSSPGFALKPWDKMSYVVLSQLCRSCGGSSVIWL